MNAQIRFTAIHWGAYLERGSLAPINQATCASDTSVTLEGFDRASISDATLREAIADELDKLGDYSRIVDFEAFVTVQAYPSRLTYRLPWAHEDSEWVWADCMFGDDD